MSILNLKEYESITKGTSFNLYVNVDSISSFSRKINSNATELLMSNGSRHLVVETPQQIFDMISFNRRKLNE